MLFRLKLLIIALVLAGGLPAMAMMIEYPVDRMVAESDGIVRGHVETLGSRWLEGPGSIIVTDLRLVVDEVWLGSFQAKQTLEFYVVGGVVDGLGMKQEHQPEFRNNEEVVLFLWTQPDLKRTMIFNDEQGAYRIAGDQVQNFRRETLSLSEFRETVNQAKQTHGRR